MLQKSGLWGSTLEWCWGQTIKFVDWACFAIVDNLVGHLLWSVTWNMGV